MIAMKQLVNRKSYMEHTMKRTSFWAWLWIVLGVLYFFVPLLATLNFSLRAKRGVLSLTAYQNVFNDSQFYQTFTFSVEMAVLTIIISALLIFPTAYWIQ